MAVEGWGISGGHGEFQAGLCWAGAREGTGKKAEARSESGGDIWDVEPEGGFDLNWEKHERQEGELGLSFGGSGEPRHDLEQESNLGSDALWGGQARLGRTGGGRLLGVCTALPSPLSRLQATAVAVTSASPFSEFTCHK